VVLASQAVVVWPKRITLPAKSARYHNEIRPQAGILGLDQFSSSTPSASIIALLINGFGVESWK
jgi:hypothetical protein